MVASSDDFWRSAVIIRFISQWMSHASIPIYIRTQYIFVILDFHKPSLSLLLKYIASKEMSTCFLHFYPFIYWSMMFNVIAVKYLAKHWNDKIQDLIDFVAYGWKHVFSTVHGNRSTLLTNQKDTQNISSHFSDEVFRIRWSPHKCPKNTAAIKSSLIFCTCRQLH